MEKFKSELKSCVSIEEVNKLGAYHLAKVVDSKNSSGLIDYIGCIGNSNIEFRDFSDNEELEQEVMDILTEVFDSIEIIYYSEAIKYLQENDQSLMDSLEIAEELGYSVSDLSSEVLASLLAGRIERENFIFPDFSEELEAIQKRIEEINELEEK